MKDCDLFPNGSGSSLARGNSVEQYYWYLIMTVCNHYQLVCKLLFFLGIIVRAWVCSVKTQFISVQTSSVLFTWDYFFQICASTPAVLYNVFAGSYSIPNSDFTGFFCIVQVVLTHQVLLSFQKVLVKELGANWRNQLVEFDMKPFAAASIGQVHRGVLKDGRAVAIKIQVLYTDCHFNS